mmetsp:Transcript_1410/g.8682  ORF Transcript_1410/g.8682 Transcript_1410/m.8682 type:complete len:296 (-) Transcript_1410:3069-3956(-)
MACNSRAGARPAQEHHAISTFDECRSTARTTCTTAEVVDEANAPSFQRHGSTAAGHHHDAFAHARGTRSKLRHVLFRRTCQCRCRWWCVDEEFAGCRRTFPSVWDVEFAMDVLGSFFVAVSFGLSFQFFFQRALCVFQRQHGALQHRVHVAFVAVLVPTAFAATENGRTVAVRHGRRTCRTKPTPDTVWTRLARINPSDTVARRVRVQAKQTSANGTSHHARWRRNDGNERERRWACANSRPSEDEERSAPCPRVGKGNRRARMARCRSKNHRSPREASREKGEKKGRGMEKVRP